MLIYCYSTHHCLECTLQQAIVRMYMSTQLSHQKCFISRVIAFIFKRSFMI